MLMQHVGDFWVYRATIHAMKYPVMPEIAKLIKPVPNVMAVIKRHFSVE
ncbi:hypothetical protein OM318_22585 [Escherichia albertii]|nr:hypothetical protein [Escherichia albertii]EFJ2288539.1 hypothetical protein [Escherichia albertii]MCU7297291.1 hypothetical protein [Escherichia albertii]MCU7306618.1 hypothetical protein [Escherichia albertii]MCZ8858846.1 hypothetical protein [Escherichia albertii]MCZ8925597.1 hypothetical protein [Escherichia albertii]